MAEDRMGHPSAYEMGARVRITSGIKEGRLGTVGGMTHDGRSAFVVIDGEEERGPRSVAVWGLEPAEEVRRG